VIYNKLVILYFGHAVDGYWRCLFGSDIPVGLKKRSETFFVMRGVPTED
jgi:hypothetical protein